MASSRVWILLVPLVSFVPSCELELDAGLDGVLVVGGNLREPRSIEWPVGRDLDLWFSDSLDPATVHEGSVALVVWEAGESCHWTPMCEEGVCGRGTCWVDPLRAGDLSDLDDGLSTSGLPIQVILLDGPAGPNSRLHVRPRRALPAHAQIELVLGAGIRGASGAPIVDWRGEPTRVRRILVTADEGSSGPEARLSSPRPGELGVPTNLGLIETRYAVPVPLPLDPDVTLALEAEDGLDRWLADPEPCPGAFPGSCLRWRPEGQLAPRTRYRPGASNLRDRGGRAGPRPAVQTWFQTGDGPDEVDPVLQHVRWDIRGACLWLSLWVDETVRLELSGPGSEGSVEGAGWLSLGLPLASLAPGTVVATATDRAGRSAVAQHGYAGAPAPPLAITEVLADPRGPEPSAELVELVALEDTLTEGLWLADRPWAEVLVALAEGQPPGDPLPPTSLLTGDVAIVVSSSYPGGVEGDPAPADGTVILPVDASLGQGGLRNDGEVISLYRAEPPQLVSSYGNWIEPEPGVSAIRPDPRACDGSWAWRREPGGSSTPGRLP